MHPLHIYEEDLQRHQNLLEPISYRYLTSFLKKYPKNIYNYSRHIIFFISVLIYMEIIVILLLLPMYVFDIFNSNPTKNKERKEKKICHYS